MDDAIAEQLEIGCFDERPDKFLPVDKFEDLLTKDAISNELGEASDLRDLVNWIHEYGREIFAVTVTCKPPGKRDDTFEWRRQVMMRFRSHNFGDEMLPIIYDRKGFHLKEGHKGEDVFPRELWSSAAGEDFADRQWRHLLPVFSKKKFDYDLPREYCIPVIWKHQRSITAGLSSVTQIQVHPAHWHYPFKTAAIKEISIISNPAGIPAAWEREAGILRLTKDFETPHMISCVAAISKGDKRYFMFPWADGGTLKGFWGDYPQPSRRATVIKETIVQLRGLADALFLLHDYGEAEESIRHGDLKPENILRFIEREPGGGPELGVLKIADLGLAKRHVNITRKRQAETTTVYSSRPYEGPERRMKGPLSRLYDIWSMGCIVLDFIIWILYGNEDLERFKQDIGSNSNDNNQGSQYFRIIEKEPNGDLDIATVNPTVKYWMEHIEEYDPECRKKSAIRDLLGLVRDKLLVVDLPPEHMVPKVGPAISIGLASDDSSARTFRATANIFRDGLDEILQRIDADTTDSYLLSARDVDVVRLPKPRSGSADQTDGRLSPDEAGRRGSRDINRQSQGLISRSDDKWEYPVDNVFARSVIEQMGQAQVMCHPEQDFAKLCQHCEHLIFWTAGFSLVCSIQELESRLTSQECDFCAMIRDICQKSDYMTKVAAKVHLTRTGSSLRMEGQINNDPVLTLLCGPELKTDLIQIGFPRLPVPSAAKADKSGQATDVLFQIIRSWLQDCDSHAGCRPQRRTRLPTRLVDLGTKGYDEIRLYETTEDDQKAQTNRSNGDGKSDKFGYIALSHPWGNTKEYTPFVTLPGDLSRFKNGICFDELPKTFKDAVVTTRALGKRYLWIDSICILQGPDGDFRQEANRMEDVFSSAYCVIAASRATDQRSGFLGPRRARKFLKLSTSYGTPYYVCEAIDNFKHDVVDGELSKRGWVLQERALARRTVFFTKTQTYFECGGGIRCETLSKLRQTEAALLGDPNFPQKANGKSKGEKIRDFTGLYKQYSALKLSETQDRPLAIAGLESRLIKAYHTRGGFGIFDDGPDKGLFHRSLLWHCAADEIMTPIVFDRPATAAMHVPSWSWMGYTGRIDYFNLPGRENVWEHNDIKPPWTEHDRTGGARVGIEATVRTCSPGQGQPGESILLDDGVSCAEAQTLHCVIIARSRTGVAEDKRHYILVVAPLKSLDRDGCKGYRRIGAGFLPGSQINWEESPFSAVIF